MLSCSVLTDNVAFAADDMSQAPHQTAPAFAGTVENLNAGDPQVGYEESPPPAISVVNVEKPALDNLGVLDQGKDGLADNIWQKSSRETIDNLLANLNSGIADDTLRNNLINLLMTRANPPSGTSSQDWFLLRVNALIKIGAGDKAEQMLASVPKSLQSQAILQLQSEVALARGDYDSACKQVRFSANIDSTDAIFWQKLGILCQAKAGKTDEAMLGLDVLRETGTGKDEDAFFQDEIHKMSDKTFVAKSMPRKISLFDFALIRAANDLERFKDKLDNFPALAIKSLAGDATLDANLRERANIRAVALGLLPAKEVNKAPEPPFAKNVASDVTSLVTAFATGNPPNDADNIVIARLAIDDATIQDARRIQRLLTLMQLFGYKVSDDVWQKIFARKNRYEGDAPAAFLVDKLLDAAANDRKAEVIILAAIIADGNESDKIGDLALLPILKSLKQAGFEKEARTIAVNAVKRYR